MASLADRIVEVSPWQPSPSVEAQVPDWHGFWHFFVLRRLARSRLSRIGYDLTAENQPVIWSFEIAIQSRPYTRSHLEFRHRRRIDAYNWRWFLVILASCQIVAINGWSTRALDILLAAPPRPRRLRALKYPTQKHNTKSFSPNSTSPDLHVHYVRATPGTPVHWQPGNAQAEFSAMFSDGTAGRSESSWASSLHMMPRKKEEWQPCGDYNQTVIRFGISRILFGTYAVVQFSRF